MDLYLDDDVVHRVCYLLYRDRRFIRWSSIRELTV